MRASIFTDIWVKIAVEIEKKVVYTIMNWLE